MALCPGTAAELVHTAGIDGGIGGELHGVKGPVVGAGNPLFNFSQANAPHPADGAGKVVVNDLSADAHRLKDLSALVGLDGGDAHLRGDAHHPVQNGLVKVLHGGVVVLVQQLFFDELSNALVGQIGVHRPGAEAQQGGKVVHVPGLGALQHHGDGGALLGADQMLLQGGHRQQGGNGHMVFVHPPVREDNHVGAVAVGLVAADEQVVQGPLQGGVFKVQQGHGLRLEPGHLHVFQLQQLHAGEDGAAQLQNPAVFRGVAEEVPVRAHIHRGIRHDLLPQGVNGRVGYLGEELLKVVKQGLLLVRENRQGDVRPHGHGGLVPGLCHGQDGLAHVLIGVAKNGVQLVPQGLVVDGYPPVGGGQVVQGDQLPVQPLSIGVGGGVAPLDLPVPLELSGNSIHQEHFAGTQTALPHDVLRRNVQHAHLRGEDHKAVVGLIVPGRPQAVPVQAGPHHVPVGEENGRRAVPGFHHGGIVVVHIPDAPGHVPVPAPGLRDGDHHRLGQLHTAEHEKLQGVVQHGRVRPAGVHHRQDFFHLAVQGFRVHGLFPGQHPVDVAPDGVNLPVVQEQPVGMGPLPAGVGVGGKPGVDQGNGGFVAGVLEVPVELPQLVDQKHTLVDNGPAAEGGHIGVPHRLLILPADNVQPAVKVQVLLGLFRPADKALPDGGHAVPGPLAQNLGIHRHLPPAQKLHPVLFHQNLKELLPLAAVKPVLGKEKHADGIASWPLQVDSLLCRGGGKEGMGDLKENAHAVAGLPGGILAGPVLQLLHDLQRAVYRAVRARSGDVHHRADPTGIMFESFVV